MTLARPAGRDTFPTMQSLLRGLAARSAAGASAGALGGVAAQRHVSMHSRGLASVRFRDGKVAGQQPSFLSECLIRSHGRRRASSGGFDQESGIASGVLMLTRNY